MADQTIVTAVITTTGTIIVAWLNARKPKHKVKRKPTVSRPDVSVEGVAATYPPPDASTNRRYLRHVKVILAVGGLVTVTSTVLAEWLKPARPVVQNVAASPVPPAPVPTPAPASTCTSPYGTCESGECSGMVGLGDRFRLHLSAMEIDQARDPCPGGRDLWLCLWSSEGSGCLSQREACSHGASTGSANSSASVIVAGRDLVSTGLRVEVREGGADGAKLAQMRLLYSSSVTRAVLCEGGLWRSKNTPPVSGFSYYLEPL